MTAFHLACQEDNFPVVRLLARAGATVEVRDAEGMSPLHVASQNASLTVARFVELGVERWRLVFLCGSELYRVSTIKLHTLNVNKI